MVGLHENAIVVPKQRNISFFSEYVQNGVIGWSTRKTNMADGGKTTVQFTNGINWNELVQTLNSVTLLEWQSWLSGEIYVMEDDTRVQIYCDNLFAIQVSGKWINGDVYRRGITKNVLKLAKGIHSVRIRLRAKVETTFSCTFKSLEEIEPPLLELFPPSFHPDILTVGASASTSTTAFLFSDLLAIPAFSFSSHWVKINKLHINDNKYIEIADDQPYLQHSKYNKWIAPGQIVRIPVRVKLTKDNVAIPCPLRFTISVWVEEDETFSFEATSNGNNDNTNNNHRSTRANKGEIFRSNQLDVSLLCRDFVGQSFVFTFIDHDGAVAHAAAIAPLKFTEVSSKRFFLLFSFVFFCFLFLSFLSFK